MNTRLTMISHEYCSGIVMQFGKQHDLRTKEHSTAIRAKCCGSQILLVCYLFTWIEPWPFSACMCLIYHSILHFAQNGSQGSSYCETLLSPVLHGSVIYSLLWTGVFTTRINSAANRICLQTKRSRCWTRHQTLDSIQYKDRWGSYYSIFTTSASLSTQVSEITLDSN